MSARFVMSQQVIFKNGKIAPGALANFYEVGTSTRRATYQDAALTTPHENPVVADANGYFPTIYLDGAYKYVVTDSGGVVLDSQPEYSGYAGDTDLDALRSQLASTSGAGMVGLEHGTVQDAIGHVTPEMFEHLKVGDDWYPALTAMLATGLPVHADKRQRYGISQTLVIPTRTHFIGSGDAVILEWIGPVPAPGSKTAMVRLAASNPAEVALADVVLKHLRIDCKFTPNLIGLDMLFASFQSTIEHVRIDDLGENGAAFRFARLWYAKGETLSVRCAEKKSGSIGFWFDTGSVETGEINAIQFQNLQTNKCSIGILLDTTQYIYVLNLKNVVLEQGDVGIRHIGKKGVRQGHIDGLYLESNTTMVDWQKDGAATDSTQQMLWTNVQTQYGTSTWNMGEGRHWIRGCDSITTLNNSGAQVRIEGDAGVTVNDTGTGRTLVIRAPTNLPQGATHASTYAKHQAVASVRRVLSAATASTEIQIPADLINTAMPAGGREIRLKIMARKYSAYQSRLWEGYLVQKDNAAWGLAASSYSSPADALWGVTVNSATGAVTVEYSDTGESKIIIASFQPM